MATNEHLQTTLRDIVARNPDDFADPYTDADVKPAPPQPAPQADLVDLVARAKRTTSPDYQLIRDLVEAIAALSAVPTTTGPESMDSAPKDGTHILARQGDRYFNCWWHDNGYGEAYWMDDADSEPNPSEWWPLTALPAALKGGAGR
jgi:hypothetical protein